MNSSSALNRHGGLTNMQIAMAINSVSPTVMGRVLKMEQGNG